MEHRGGAFAYGEVDTEADKDTRAQLERNLELQKTEGDGTYRGQAGYKSYVKKDEAQIGANKYTGTKGPIRAPQFVRNTCRFDYQPDVCKDYKDTGFCGYGALVNLCTIEGDYKTGGSSRRSSSGRRSRAQGKMLGSWTGRTVRRRERDKFRIRDGGDSCPSRAIFAGHLMIRWSSRALCARIPVITSAS